MMKFFKKSFIITILVCIFAMSIYFNHKNAEAAQGDVVSSFVKVTKVKRNANRTVTVDYQVLKTIDSIAGNISIGYEWPAEYKNSETKKVSIKNKVGNHSLTIPAPTTKLIGFHFKPHIDYFFKLREKTGT